MQTNAAAEQSKIIRWPGVRVISPVGKEKVYGGKDLVDKIRVDLRSPTSVGSNAISLFAYLPR